MLRLADADAEVVLEERGIEVAYQDASLPELPVDCGGLPSEDRAEDEVGLGGPWPEYSGLRQHGGETLALRDDGSDSLSEVVQILERFERCNLGGCVNVVRWLDPRCGE